LIIDAQADFLSPTALFPCINADKVVEKISRVINLARKVNLPVIYTREVHHRNGVDYGLELKSGTSFQCVEGTLGVEIMLELKPLPGEHVIAECRYNAFLVTHMDLILNSFGHPALYITSLNTNVSGYCTAVEAWQRDYPVCVISECVSGTNEERHHLALQMLNFISRWIVINIEDFLLTHSYLLTWIFIPEHFQMEFADIGSLFNPKDI
jgi:nicotinamidase-related amidase